VSVLAGEVSGTVYLEYRINIIATTIVKKDAVLKIKPGSALVFLNPEAQLIVYGSIQALGDKGEPIYFESPEPNTSWSGIKLKNSLERSIFKYCRFRRAKVALEIENANVFIWQCRFRENEETLLIRGKESKVLVKENSFMNNQANWPSVESIRSTNINFEKNYWLESKIDAQNNQAYNRLNELKITSESKDPTDWSVPEK